MMQEIILSRRSDSHCPQQVGRQNWGLLSGKSRHSEIFITRTVLMGFYVYFCCALGYPAELRICEGTIKVFLVWTMRAHFRGDFFFLQRYWRPFHLNIWLLYLFHLEILLQKLTATFFHVVKSACVYSLCQYPQKAVVSTEFPVCIHRRD